MGMRDIESRLPPGFRFYPSDEELVCHYLYKKVSNEWISTGATMMEVDLHKQEPWELPEGAKLSANEWYFFSFRDRKYATGSRTNRATKTGYWKATGKDRIIYEQGTQAMVGMRKTLVFYGGRAPNGIKTDWVMHEFRLENPHLPPKEDWVLCRVFHKTKAGLTARFSMEKEQDELEMEEVSFHCNSQTLDIDEGMRDYGIYQYDDNSPNACQMNLAAVLHHNFMDLYPAAANHSDAVQGLHLDNNKCPVLFGNTNGKNGVADDYRFLIEMGLVVDRDPRSTVAAAAAESMIKQDCIIKSHI